MPAQRRHRARAALSGITVPRIPCVLAVGPGGSRSAHPGAVPCTVEGAYPDAYTDMELCGRGLQTGMDPKLVCRTPPKGRVTGTRRTPTKPGPHRARPALSDLLEPPPWPRAPAS